MAKVALALGYGGKNPAAYWYRWESGASEPPLSVVIKVDAMSDGQVTLASWVDVRRAYIARAAQQASA